MSERSRLLFDGECPLCRKSVAILKRLDWLGKVSYVNARDEADPAVRAIPVDKARLLEEMHLWPAGGGAIEHGFRAFRWLAWRMPLLWLVAPFLYLPGVPWLGQKVYLWIARNRFRLVPCRDGVCTIQKPVR